MSIIKHVTLQKIVAHDFRYDLRIIAVNTDSMTGCQTSKLGIFLGSFISQCCQLVRYNVDGL